MTKKTQHVVPSMSGGWNVRASGSLRATKHFGKQEEAIAFAKDISKRQQTELFVHKTDGTIQSRNSYGNDPCPPKDKR
ncbi:hypothetical protein Barb6_00266 [Bacteroidales bacterium Barb6]|nr:hypothetical protein Barb6XT_01766 [Bacteroidales bacterium Barb6XT]OAV73410.1 hypothetical protein Barb6_00266 [Bacteroidales bacterium Barb6]